MKSNNGQPSKSSEERGAVFVELVFTLPLLLLLVWFFIYIGTIYNAKTSLVSAMDNSVRSAMTRGYLSETLSNRNLYDRLDDLCYFQNSPDMAGILFSRADVSSSERTTLINNYNQTTEHWDGWTDAALDSGHFCNQPLHNLYAVIFTQLAMKKSVGRSLRFPCDPQDDDQEGGGAGCMRCIPLNPCTMDRAEVNPAIIQDADDQVCDSSIINHRVAIECEYRPASIFVRPIDGLVRALTGQGIATNSTISYKTYYDLPMDYDWNLGQ